MDCPRRASDGVQTRRVSTLKHLVFEGIWAGHAACCRWAVRGRAARVTRTGQGTDNLEARRRRPCSSPMSPAACHNPHTHTPCCCCEFTAGPLVHACGTAVSCRTGPVSLPTSLSLLSIIEPDYWFLAICCHQRGREPATREKYGPFVFNSCEIPKRNPSCASPADCCSSPGTHQSTTRNDFLWLGRGQVVLVAAPRATASVRRSTTIRSRGLCVRDHITPDLTVTCVPHHRLHRDLLSQSTPPPSSMLCRVSVATLRELDKTAERTQST